MKRVRMLLRVSSNQQLEADGDLSVQRQLVKDYISNQFDWQLDEKEYFEGSNSGYKMQWQTEMFCRRRYRMQKRKNTTF